LIYFVFFFFCLILMLIKIEVAICPNTNEIHIYKKNGNNWTLGNVLKEVKLYIYLLFFIIIYIYI